MTSEKYFGTIARVFMAPAIRPIATRIKSNPLTVNRSTHRRNNGDTNDNPEHSGARRKSHEAIHPQDPRALRQGTGSRQALECIAAGFSGTARRFGSRRGSKALA